MSDRLAPDVARLWKVGLQRLCEARSVFVVDSGGNAS